MALKDLLHPETKILIADDVCSARRALRKELSRLGFSNIIEARDGSEAYDLVLSEKGVGLIISDWQMPDMSSAELLEHIRAESTFADIPFVVSTSRSEWDEVSEAAPPEGIRGYLAKPFAPDTLERELEGALRSQA